MSVLNYFSVGSTLNASPNKRISTKATIGLKNGE